MSKITYVLEAFYDGDLIFRSEYPDTTELQENGLRKAEHAVEKALDEDEELGNE